MKREAEENADSDRKMKEEIDKLNAADSMIFQTEKQLKEFGDKIPADKKAPIEKALEELKEAHKSKDIARIDTALANLNNVWQAASAEMYQATQQQPGADNTKNTDKSNEGKANNDVTDVDFEEVK